jgi:hypothetical protein
VKNVAGQDVIFWLVNAVLEVERWGKEEEEKV